MIHQATTQLIRFFGKSLAALALAGASVLPAMAEEDAPQPPMNSWALIEALQGGGHVLYIRHERTEVPSRADDYSRPASDCRAQRNLSVSGVAAAYETGMVLRAVDIPISRVIASPMCRGTETARYMFGVGYELDTRLMHHDPSKNSSRNMDTAVAEAQALLAELAPIMGDTNIALVGHGGTIRRVTGLSLTEGEIAVLRLSETGEVTALGQLTGSAMGFYARWQDAQDQ
ncbi:MAG: hypothetical protein AAGF20_07740 [Pseudomonadota bacterium]